MGVGHYRECHYRGKKKRSKLNKLKLVAIDGANIFFVDC
jgi:hypothetical protein